MNKENIEVEGKFHVEFNIYIYETTQIGKNGLDYIRI